MILIIYTFEITKTKVKSRLPATIGVCLQDQLPGNVDHQVRF